MPILC